MKQFTKRTPEERQALTERVIELRASGKTLKEACDIAGIVPSVFYSYKKYTGAIRKPKRAPKAAPYSQEISTTTTATGSAKVACIIGTPSDISAVLRGLS